jgi:hypothetical protein
MGQTRKDSEQIVNTILELLKRPDGRFDVFLNGNLNRSGAEEKWLIDDLCVRFGFCGEEFDPILSEVNRVGRTRLTF